MTTDEDLFHLSAHTPNGWVYARLNNEGDIAPEPDKEKRGRFPRSMAMAIAFQEECGLGWIVTPEDPQ